MGETASAQSSAIRDVDADGVLDAGMDFLGGASRPFTGYYALIGGKPYAIFVNALSPSICCIPYDSSQDDLAAFLPLSDRTGVEISQNVTTTTAFCFGSGTRIATESGAIPVEALRPGDDVRTSEGAVTPVTWIGYQRVATTAANLPIPAERRPVRIAKGTLRNDADLIVSADHGLLLDGCVINASALINGHSIRTASAREVGASFTYWHVETPQHTTILANGTPAETFFDARSRAAFDNYADYRAHVGADRLIREMTLPRITAARLVPERLRARLGIEPLARCA